MNAWDWFMLLAGLVLLGVGGEALVRGASRLARLLGLTPLIVGVTVVAVGTSAPEMAVSLNAAMQGQEAVSVGNVVGSNLLNLLVVLGAAAILMPLRVAQRLIWWDIPIMIGATALVLALGWDGRLSQLDGILLLVLVVVYLVAAVVLSGGESEAVQKEYEEEFGGDVEADSASLGRLAASILFGLALLVFGADIFVDGAVGIARSFGVSELLISLTIVAIGTSLPELVTALVAASRGQSDIAVGNVVGSNIMNLLAILGLTAAISSGGLMMPAPVLVFDLPILLLASVACLPILWSGHRLSRREGIGFLAAYVGYITWLLATA
ncbi:MAG: calcium/sodium antiporter [Deltaproteobacteria bacterium]